MHFNDWRVLMRGAVYGGDGAAVVGLLIQDPAPVTSLQLVGEGLLSAVAQGVEGARDLAVVASRDLRDRNWYGDMELAAHLEGMLGVAAMPNLRPLPVDLEELAGILEGDPLQEPGRIDLETGEVWPDAEIEYAETVGEEEPQRWLWVTPRDSRAGYDDMELFIGAQTNLDLRDRVQGAVAGRDVFGRFEEILADWPAELEQWHAFSDDRRRGRARYWLAAAGYRQAVPARPRIEI